MPSLVSHQLSIIKYVVLKKIFFFLCFDRLIWTWTWTWTWTRTSLDSDLTRTRTSLDLDLTRTRTSLDLDLSWTRQRWTWLQPYQIHIDMKSKQACIKQTRETKFKACRLPYTGRPELSAGIYSGSILSSLHWIHPRYQEHIRELPCVLCTCVLENWNWTSTVDDDIEREHKDARSLALSQMAP